MAAGETTSLTGEFIGETHRFLECTQTHPPGNQHQKGPICLWVAEEVTESRWRAEQGALFLLGTFHHIQHHNAASRLPCPGKYLRLHPLLHNRLAKTKKNGPNEKTDQSSRKNTTKWWRDSQLIRCTVQNTGNQEAQKLVEFGCKLDEKMKAMLRETKENVQGTNSDAKETGTQINSLEQKEEINSQPEQNEETRIRKN